MNYGEQLLHSNINNGNEAHPLQIPRLIISHSRLHRTVLGGGQCLLALETGSYLWRLQRIRLAAVGNSC